MHLRTSPGFIILTAVVLLYLALATGRAITGHPWNDEAWYASPSLSLIQQGHTGTPLLETEGQFWKGINQRTYWVVPLQFFAQVPWFKLFGFSLLSARFFGIAWGLVALASWFAIVQRLTGDRAAAIATVLLIACDYQFVAQTALARMDAMSLGLASAGLAFYLVLREKNLTQAVIVSHACVVACGLTHPTPGVPAFAAVVFLTLYLDRSRLKWAHLALAVLPYAAGAAAWWWYISPAPDLFRAQFFGNVTDIDRLGGFKNPLLALFREIRRHAAMGGFEPGLHPLYKIKILVIAVYAVSVIGYILTPRLRNSPGTRTLFYLWLVYFLVMTVYDNTKEVKYAVHLVALYDALVAVWAVTLWKSREAGSIVPRWAAAALAGVFVVVSTAGLLYTIFVKRDYQRSFEPVAAFLRQEASPGALILAGSEFGFELGFDRNIVDDTLFGYYSGKIPDYAVIGPNYRNFLEHHRAARPDVYRYFENLLNKQYTRVYSNEGYEVFKRDRRELNVP